MTFHPGIWTLTDRIWDWTIFQWKLQFSLLQSNTVTFTPNGSMPCQVYNLSETEQFTAPEDSVVGFYIGLARAPLLVTKADSSITTYKVSGNQSSVTVSNSDDVNYNIAIRVHIGKHSHKYC